MRLSFLALMLGGLVFGMNTASAAVADYAGHYELAGKNPDRIFTVELLQTGSKVQAQFFGAVTSIANAKINGDGTGRVDGDGLLKIKFKDNFGNEGVALIQSSKQGVVMDMRLTKMVNANSAHFYGLLQMQKTAGSSYATNRP